MLFNRFVQPTSGGRRSDDERSEPSVAVRLKWAVALGSGRGRATWVWVGVSQKHPTQYTHMARLNHPELLNSVLQLLTDDGSDLACSLKVDPDAMRVWRRVSAAEHSL